MKVFKDTTRQMAIRERAVLEILRVANTLNIPTCLDLVDAPTHCALILTPIGVPVMPYPSLNPAMLLTLLETVRSAHAAGWVHRDIKPDNILLDEINVSSIILNDWSSAAALNVECAYVGTRLFGDRPSETHVPTRQLDLRSLVRTAFCLSKQHLPPLEDNDVAVREYWDRTVQAYPLVGRAMAAANAANYENLAICFRDWII